MRAKPPVDYNTIGHRGERMVEAHRFFTEKAHEWLSLDGPEAAPRWVELGWESNGDSGRLTVRESAILPGSDAPGSEPLWRGTVLDATKFRFEYLPRRLPNQTAAWIGEWPAFNLQMPAAVRLSYTRRGRQHQMVLPLEYAENSWSGRWFR